MLSGVLARTTVLRAALSRAQGPGLAAVLAWPLAADAAAWRFLPAVLGALAWWWGAASATPSRARRVVAEVGVAALTAAAIGQRLDEPSFGLFALIGLSLAWVGLAPPEPSRRGADLEPRPLATHALALALLATADAVAAPRLLLLAWVAASATVALVRPRAPEGLGSLVDAVVETPARMLVVSFASLATAGALLLMLPVASTAPGSIRAIDALFTSVSASCVTGLAVLDTPRDFTLFGQVVIAVLFQLGGIGIMTFAAAGALLLGRRLGVREEAWASELVGGDTARTDLERALSTVVRVTLWSEGAGAVVLTGLFVWGGDPLPQALWRAVFTSISAFCNAGFALQSDSLIRYHDQPAVLATVGVLIVLGGLGPLVVMGLPAVVRGRGSLHARLVVVSSAALLVVPAALFLAIEWGGVLAGMSLADKLSNAWFQSVTLRTAGFNSIDFAAIQPATWTLALFCMFVGGSPGSTAGGAKTTTLAVLVLAIVAAIRGRFEVDVFGRRIPHRTVYEATAVTTLGVLAVCAAVVALQLTQNIGTDVLLFEVVSALGTVGLSMGGTAQLDDVGKVVISMCMFAGRVGPLTLFIFLLGRDRSGRKFPLEPLQVG